MGKNILFTEIDEGASTYIMSMSCWKSLGSPKLDTSETLLKSFDGNMFHPHGIIIALPIELGSKTFYVVVEVVDAPLEYNLLLRNIWFYDMIIDVSSIFRVLHFPHRGKIVVIDQLALCSPDLRSNVGSNIPFVGDTQQSYMDVVVGIFKESSLMGMLHLLRPPLVVNIYPINMISSFTSRSLGSFDPWVVPHPKDVESYGSSMPLSTVDISFAMISLALVDTGQHLHHHLEFD
jgi:hypothetical protein